MGNIAPLDKPGYLPAHLFVAQTLAGEDQCDAAGDRTGTAT